MRAEQLMQLCGEDLVGGLVLTEPMGEYPGGLAIVTNLVPDPGAPDIAFNVWNDDWTDDEGGHEIGVFTYEDVVLLG